MKVFLSITSKFNKLQNTKSIAGLKKLNLLKIPLMEQNVTYAICQAKSCQINFSFIQAKQNKISVMYAFQK